MTLEEIKGNMPTLPFYTLYKEFQSYLGIPEMLDKYGPKDESIKKQYTDISDEIFTELNERCNEVELVQFVDVSPNVSISVVDGSAIQDAESLKNIAAACLFHVWKIENKKL